MKPTMRGAVAGLMAVALVALAGPTAHAAAPAGYSYQDRLDGPTRYETSVAITRQRFAQPPAVTVYIASGENYPDALAGAAAAGVGRFPVLLGRRDGLPASVLDELRRLQPSRVVLLGGTGALGTSVEAQARTVAGDVARIEGANRYETAAKVSASTFAPGVPVAYLASGTSFPDALAGAAAAAHQGGPVLLTAPGGLSPAAATELARLQPGRIVVLGGTGAVSAGVLDAAARIASTERVAGADRYATAIALSAKAFGGAPTVYLASGQNFPDALAGAARAGADASPVLLVPSSGVTASVCGEVTRLAPTVVRALGGEGAVSNATLRRAAQKCHDAVTSATCTHVGVGGLDSTAGQAVSDIIAAVRDADAAVSTRDGLASAIVRLEIAVDALAAAGSADVCQQAYYDALLWQVRADVAQASFDSSIFDRSVMSYRSAREGLRSVIVMVNEDLKTDYKLP